MRPARVGGLIAPCTAVFIQNPDSIYDDAHGQWYNFPRQYLGMVKETVGDWVVFYEGRRGAFGYTHVQKVTGIRPDPVIGGRFYADLDLHDMLDFESLVPRQRPDGTMYESTLPVSRGNNTAAVRRLSSADFAAIVNAGLREVPDIDAHPRTGPLHGLAEEQAPFTPDRRHVLSSRPARDAAFARMVRRAYGGRCAISGLRLRNGGGRAEVQACHIRSVEDGGPDVVRNGIAPLGNPALDVRPRPDPRGRRPFPADLRQQGRQADGRTPREPRAPPAAGRRRSAQPSASRLPAMASGEGLRLTPFRSATRSCP